MSRDGFVLLVQVELGLVMGGSDGLDWFVRGMDSLGIVDGWGAGSGKDGWISYVDDLVEASRCFGHNHLRAKPR